MPGARPETHVQFRVPAPVAEALEARARKLGRSRAVTAKLILTKELQPAIYKSWMKQLSSEPDRRRLTNPH